MNKKICYNDFERRVLIDLVGKYHDIVHSKCTDANTVHKKQQIWLRITNEYNRHPNVRKRLKKQLKRLWENIKARTKKKQNINLSNNYIDSLMINNNCNNNTSEFAEILIANDNVQQQQLQNTSASEGATTTSTTNTSLSQQPLQNHSKRKQSNDIIVDNSNIYDDGDDNDDDEDEECIDRFLTPIISTKIKKIEQSIDQQKELHNLSVKRDQLQIQLLQEQLRQQIELHSQKLEQAKEFHVLRVQHENEFHVQRIRNEQELHQVKLTDYNKVQNISYPLLYK